MINEYVVDPHFSWIGAHGNLVFLKESKDDAGGRWAYLEDRYLYSGDPTPKYTGMSMDDGSRITLGGIAKADFGEYSYYTNYLPDYLFEDPSNKAYNLFYYGYNIQGSVATADFAGSGEIDFASATGAGSINSGTGITPSTDGPESPIIIVGNIIDTQKMSLMDNSAWAKTSATIIKGSEDFSAYGLRSSGDFTVLGDMSAQIFAYSSNGYLAAYHDATSQDASASIDICTGNTANAAGYRVGTFTVENIFNGFLYSESNNFYTQHYNVANYSSNTIGAYGIWSSGLAQLNGKYTGAIHVEANDTSLTNYGIAGKEGSNKNASASNNKISAIGIQGDNIVLADFFDSSLSGNDRDVSIHTEVKNTTIQAESSGGNGSSATATGNVIKSVGISGNSLTLNGVFEGSLYGEVSELRIDNWGGASNPAGDNSVYLCGIYLTGALTANRNFSGDFELNYNTTRPALFPSIAPAALEANIYGIWADSITVNGSIRSNINITVADDFHDWVYNTEYIAGVRADNLTASAYEGNISVKNARGFTVAAGLIADSFSSGNDNTFDVSGDITVTGDTGYLIGILGATTKAMDIRVSGDIISDYRTTSGYTYLSSTSFSIFAGWYTSQRGSTRYNFDDRVEIAAGAYVEGHIDLQNGQNTLIVDSNARIYGDVLSDLGKLNLEFVLNDQAFGGVVSSAAASQAAILRAGSDAVLSSTCNVTLNLNSAETTSYIIYQGTLGTQGATPEQNTGWYARAINFKYQGITTAVIAKYGITLPADSDLVKVTSKGITGRVTVGNPLELTVTDSEGITHVFFSVEAVIVGNQVKINVTMPEGYDVAQPLEQISDVAMNYDHENRTAKLSWTDPDGRSGEAYEVEYRIVTEGNPGKSIVQTVTNGSTSVTLKNIEANQTVEWRIRQNLGSGDSISQWRTWGDNPATDIPTQENDIVTFTAPTAAKYVAGESAASAVSVLAWDPGTYSEGLKYYVVQYFQSSVRLDESTMNDAFWNNVASVKKQVTNNQLQVSGLNNTEYFYWRVCAFDIKNNQSPWTTGEMFRSYNDDTTPPVFGETPTSSVVYVTPTPQPDPFTVTANTLDLILNWKAATDDRSGVSRYTVSWKLSTDTDWTSQDISVTNENQTAYSFRLSDYADLVANGTYQWRITASDYVGRTSTAQSGTWTTDTTGPSFTTGSVDSTASWIGGAKPLSITVTWDAAADEEGGSGLYYYQLRYKTPTAASWTVVNLDTTKLSWNLKLLNADVYNYEVSAFDVAGNESSVASGIWRGDSVAPTFDDTSEITVQNSYNPTSKSSILLFNWSTATDSSLGPVSGFSYYELAYYDANGKRIVLGTYDEDTLSATITVGRTSGQIHGLADGYYNWDITAYDAAGNGQTVPGTPFLIDTAPPVGNFTFPSWNGTVDMISVASSTNTVLSGFGGTPVESGDTTYTWEVTDISVTFTFNGNFTDNSGKVYYVLQVSDSDRFTGDNTYEFVTDQATLTLDHTNGFGAGSMAKDKQVYWRVQAMDASGNLTGAWTKGSTFYFASDKTGQYIRDTVAPTAVTNTSVTISDRNTVNTVTLNWGAASDVFGVKYYEVVYSAKGVSSKTIRVSATDTSTILKFKNGLADGLYSWKIRAVDYVGLTSAWVNGTGFLVDTKDPVFNTSSFKLTSVQGARDIGFTWAPAQDANLSYYVIEITAPNGEISYVKTEGTKYWLYNQPDGLYSFRACAIDLLGNSSEWSVVRKFMVDTSSDPGSTFVTAAPLAFTGTRSSLIGGSDTGDMYKITLTTASSVSITISNVDTLDGKTVGVKVNVYDSNHKKIKSLSVKSGTKSLDDLLLNVVGSSSDYYIEVVSAANTSIETYTIGATKQEFQPASGNTNWTDATPVALTGGVGSFTGGWVGFGDPADYYEFTTTNAGAVTIDLSGITPNTPLKVSLYSLVDGKYKKMASTTVKADMTNVFKKDVLAQTGKYYLVIESGDGGKGKYNSDYNFTVNDSYYKPATPNSDWTNATPVTLSADGVGTFADGWVGFGDPADYYKFTTAGAGGISVDFSTANSNAVLKVSLYTLVDGKYKKLSTATVKGNLDNIFKKDVLTQAGEYYLVVESGDKGKGKYNSSYDFTVNDGYFPIVGTHNGFGSATEKQLAAQTNLNGWVGFGDPADYYRVTAADPGSITFSFNTLTTGTQIKVSLYDLSGKKLKSYTVTDKKPLHVDNMLFTGDFYLAVESGDLGKGKQNTGYFGSITYEAFPKTDGGSNLQGVPTSVNFETVGAAEVAQVNDWVGYGDSVDYFSFALDQAGRVDLDLALDNAGVRVGKELKVTLYDSTGKKLKLDANLTSGELALGAYTVAVEIAKPEKYWTGYDLAITKLA